jgi:carbamoyl-phosphate synthase large subunit
VREGRPHVVDMIKNDEIDLIVNTTEGKQAIRESNSIRREAVHRRVTYYTTSPPDLPPARRSITWTRSR